MDILGWISAAEIQPDSIQPYLHFLYDVVFQSFMLAAMNKLIS